MVKCHLCFLIVCIRKSKLVNIFCISHISCWSLFFLNFIGKSKRKICTEFCFSICSSGCLFNQCAFLYNYSTIHICNVTGNINSKNTSVQKIFCILILLCHNNFCFLSVIRKSCFRKYHFYILSCISKFYCLFFPCIIKTGRSLYFLYNICTKMQIFKNYSTIGICCQILLYQITFTVNFCTISSCNIRSGINIINSTFLSAFFISECCSVFCHLCTCENFTLFIYSKLSKLFFIRNSYRSRLADFQLHIVGCSINTITAWCSNLFQINGILCLNDLCRCFSIRIRCRQFCNQVLTVCITV